jgi:hypothetical protein
MIGGHVVDVLEVVEQERRRAAFTGVVVRIRVVSRLRGVPCAVVVSRGSRVPRIGGVSRTRAVPRLGGVSRLRDDVTRIAGIGRHRGVGRVAPVMADAEEGVAGGDRQHGEQSDHERGG